MAKLRFRPPLGGSLALEVGETMSALQQEFQYYLANQEELIEKYDGRVIAIKGEEVLGDYDSYLSALTETTKDHKEGTFLLQKVSAGAQDYTATFHSRVAF